jgi:hypothetical protein
MGDMSAHLLDRANGRTCTAPVPAGALLYEDVFGAAAEGPCESRQGARVWFSFAALGASYGGCGDSASRRTKPLSAQAAGTTTLEQTNRLVWCHMRAHGVQHAGRRPRFQGDAQEKREV